MTISAISVENLVKNYGERRGVADVNFAIEPGTVLGFLGPNGAGKTTVIRVIMGFLRPNSGGATVAGLDCWRDSHRIKRDVGYIAGDFRLYSWMTGNRALSIVSDIRKQDLTDLGRALAERFELDLAVPVRKMSRGMRQKLGLILALAHDPNTIVFDEPSSGLDPPMQDLLYELLEERARNGATVLFSSHTLSEVEQICDRVVIIREGAIVENERIDVLKEKAHREVIIDWKDSQAGDYSFPDFFTLTEGGPDAWHGTIDGSSVPLVEWCSGKPVADLSIGPPNLVNLFNRYYQ